MKHKLLCALLLLGSVASKAQSPVFSWAKQINSGITGDIAITAMATDAAGSLYTTGVFDGTVDFDPGPAFDTVTEAGFGDLFISKMDSSGNFLWEKHIGGMSYDQGSALTIDASGNIYLTGFFSTDSVDFDPGPGSFFMSGGEETFVLKLDKDGGFIWAKQIEGLNENQANSISLDQQGNILLTGQFSGTADFDPGPGTHSMTSNSTDIYILKLDNNGGFVWSKQIDALSGSIAYSIASDNAGSVFVSGILLGTMDADPGSAVFNLVNGQSTAAGFVLKLNAAGDFTWAKKIEKVDLGLSGGNIQVDMTGNLYLAGYFSGTLDFDPDATVHNLTASAGNSFFLLQLDNNGAFSWVNQLPDIKSTMLDDVGNIYTCGNSIRKFNASGASQWVSDSSLSKRIAIAADGSIYTTGSFTGSFDFDPGPGVYTLTDTAGTGVFIQRLKQPVATGIRPLENKTAPFVYPNPAADYFYVQSPDTGIFTLSDMMGRRIAAISAPANKPVQVDISRLPAGLYLLSDGVTAMKITVRH